jgi:hypothetical protein
VAYESFQKSPVKPKRRNTTSASSALGGSQSSAIRSRYQAADKSYIVCTLADAPRLLPVSDNHPSRSASDRKQ